MSDGAPQRSLLAVMGEEFIAAMKRFYESQDKAGFTLNPTADVGSDVLKSRVDVMVSGIAAIASIADSVGAMSMADAVAAAAAAAAAAPPPEVLDMNPGLKWTYKKDPERWTAHFRWFSEYSKRNNLPIVSVGSGNGALELWLKDKFDCEIVCTDPDPLEWNADQGSGRRQVLHMAPAAATVPELLETRPELKGECLALFNWTYPSKSYDFEALIALRPQMFLSVYEPPGAAHSSSFHRFLGSMGPPAPSSGEDGSNKTGRDRVCWELAGAVGSEYSCLSYMTAPRRHDGHFGMYAIALAELVPSAREQPRGIPPPLQYTPFDQEAQWEEFRHGLNQHTPFPMKSWFWGVDWGSGPVL